MILAQKPLHYEGRVFTLQRGFHLRFEPLRPDIPISSLL